MNSILAVQPEKSNMLPWFSRVVDIDENDKEVTVRWFHKKSDTTYFYMDDGVATVPFGAIICNGIDFEPVYSSVLYWRLLTPMSFIRQLNCYNPPKLKRAHNVSVTPKVRELDITKLVFSNAKEFKSFVIKNANVLKK